MVDRYGRTVSYLRLSVTDLCNLRCRYCMPETGVCKKQHDEMLTEDEMITAVEAAASLGITKLRITGGEPLVKKNILDICRRSAAVSGMHEITMTTNGEKLAIYATDLIEAGVSRINISLDTLDPEKYLYMTRLGRLENVLDGLAAALEAGFDKIKINTVLIRGFNDDEIRKIADLTQEYPIDVRFIELMPMAPTVAAFSHDAFLPYQEVLGLFPDAVPLPQDGGIAKRFRLPGALGNIGFITPVSEHFCDACNRIRLTADGKIKPCLHGAAEYSVKGLDLDAMIETMKCAIEAKPLHHAGLDEGHCSEAGRSMNAIGG